MRPVLGLTIGSSLKFDQDSCTKEVFRESEGRWNYEGEVREREMDIIERWVEAGRNFRTEEGEVMEAIANIPNDAKYDNDRIPVRIFRAALSGGVLANILNESYLQRGWWPCDSGQDEEEEGG